MYKSLIRKPVTFLVAMIKYQADGTIWFMGRYSNQAYKKHLVEVLMRHHIDQLKDPNTGMWKR